MDWIEQRLRKLTDFENKTVTYRTSPVRDALDKSGEDRTTPIPNNFETKIVQLHKSILSRDRNRINHTLEKLKHD
jgi:hypothetical protein